MTDLQRFRSAGVIRQASGAAAAALKMRAAAWDEEKRVNRVMDRVAGVLAAVLRRAPGDGRAEVRCLRLTVGGQRGDVAREDGGVGLQRLDIDLARDFTAEAQEHFDIADENLLILEKNPGNIDSVSAVFRCYRRFAAISFMAAS